MVSGGEGTQPENSDPGEFSRCPRGTHGAFGAGEHGETQRVRSSSKPVCVKEKGSAWCFTLNLLNAC